jgi:NADH dehydrogenase
VDDLADRRAAGEEDQVPLLVQKRGRLRDTALDDGDRLGVEVLRHHLRGLCRGRHGDLRRTVEVRTGAAVAAVEPTRVALKSGEVLNAHTLVWGAGLQGHPLVRSLGVTLERGNRIGADSALTLAGHPEVYVVGDAAAILDAKTQQVLPQLGSVALQSGEHAGATIARRIAGKKTTPFAYKDKGTMAAIGRGAACVQFLGGRTMTGKKAQVSWLTVHLALLPTNEDRARAVVDWAGAAVTHERAGRFTVGSS